MLEGLGCWGVQGAQKQNLLQPAGQANYGWGNMVCEMLCESRRRAGLPGLAVSWGAVGGVGYVEEVLEVTNLMLATSCVHERCPLPRGHVHLLS